MSEPDRFAELAGRCDAAGVDAMLDSLAGSLAARGRWHGVFDVRIMQARIACGLPPVGVPGDVPPDLRDAFDARSLAACREVGWPLLDAGEVAAGWMYLRAAAEPAEVAARLAAIARPLVPRAHDADADRTLQEILGVVLWDAADPALGMEIVLATQGTCPAVTAFEQAVSRLPASRQRPAAAILVAHLQRELHARLAECGGGDAGPHVDVSHLHSVLRLARLCDDEPTIRRCHELAEYACRIPAHLASPGEPPFEDVGEASRLFYGSQLGIDVDRAVRFFRDAAAEAGPEAGSLPHDVLVLLLWRLGRPAEALHAAVSRPSDADAMPSTLRSVAALPPLVGLAAAAGRWDMLREACLERGDEITFAAALAAERQNTGTIRGPQAPHRPQGAPR